MTHRSTDVRRAATVCALTRALALLACTAACTRDAAGRDTPDARGAGGDAAGDVALDGPARSDAEAIVALLPAGGDAAVRSARAALAMDAGWRATAALAPALADPARRTPTMLVLAAAAAAEREEWETTTRLAGAVPDTAALGFGPLLVARAALARGAGGAPAPRVSLARTALDAARRAAAHAGDATERGVRMVLVARALDRLAGVAEEALRRADSLASGSPAPRPNGEVSIPTRRDDGRGGGAPQDLGTARALADSARAAYAAAADLLPPIADWLALRAAEVTRDAATRSRAYARLTLPAARERRPASEATARERAGDPSGAADAWAAAGRPAKALSLRLAALAPNDPRRAMVRDSLVRLVVARGGTAEAGEAVELLDTAFGTRALTPAEELAVARSAAASGPAARAIAAYARALAADEGTPRDRYVYALLLSRAGRTSDAMAELTRVRAVGGPLAGDAAYQRARLLLRARNGGARAALAEVARTFAGDAEAAASALYLLADLAVDEGHDADARALLLRLAREHGGSRWAPRARFDAAIIALAGGDAPTARRELDALRTAPRPAGEDTTPSEEVLAATYWAGRAAAAAGDAAGARARWREAAERVPSSYYAMLAARRLGRAPWAPAGGGDAAAAPAVVAEAVRRIALLERVGFDPEAGWEREWLARWADTSAARLLAAGRSLGDAGATSAGMRLARRALERGAAPSAASYRVLYPWPWEPLVREAARAQGVDPALVAAVIRQESSFTPGATSSAGAVGLMQLMPPVGRALWSALGAARAGVPWAPALLRQPDVSVALGTRHLASSLAQYPDAAYALAAYNAGGTPVARWRRRPGAGDPELFVERIAYDETRDYVRVVGRNRAFYRALYGQ